MNIYIWNLGDLWIHLKQRSVIANLNDLSCFNVACFQVLIMQFFDRQCAFRVDIQCACTCISNVRLKSEHHSKCVCRNCRCWCDRVCVRSTAWRSPCRCSQLIVCCIKFIRFQSCQFVLHIFCQFWRFIQIYIVTRVERVCCCSLCCVCIRSWTWSWWTHYRECVTCFWWTQNDFTFQYCPDIRQQICWIVMHDRQKIFFVCCSVIRREQITLSCVQDKRQWWRANSNFQLTARIVCIVVLLKCCHVYILFDKIVSANVSYCSKYTTTLFALYVIFCICNQLIV
jgi:hypothetical protein